MVTHLEVLVRYVLDPLRWALGAPVTITSGYRTRAVNEAVSGSPTSQHMLGEAADVMARARARAPDDAAAKARGDAARAGGGWVRGMAVG